MCLIFILMPMENHDFRIIHVDAFWHFQWQWFVPWEYRKPLEKAITKYQKEISNRMKGANLHLSRVKVTTKEIRISRLCSISRRVMSETPRVLCRFDFHIFPLGSIPGFCFYLFIYFLNEVPFRFMGHRKSSHFFLKTKIKDAES